jgi:hypothetical protein
MKITTQSSLIKVLMGLCMAMSLSFSSLAFAGNTYLAITMKIDPQDRASAGAVYAKYKAQFLKDVKGAKTKQLLIRDEDVQVLHGFSSKKEAENYLSSELFTKHVVTSLKPLMKAEPEIRIYSES